METGVWLPIEYRVELPPQAGWCIATDGSGQEIDGMIQAAWSVVILRMPVMAEMWDHKWLGARERTKTMAELSAIIKLLLWLNQEPPDNGIEPFMQRYDSK